jgi:hypothetical protein
MTRRLKPPKMPQDIARQENRLYFSRAYERPSEIASTKQGGDASSRLGAVKSKSAYSLSER